MAKKTALVTGASRGIGLSIAELFKKNGLEVLTPNRQELDLLSEDSITKFLKKNSQTQIDILVNNAGINIIENVSEFLDENLKTALQINLISPMILIRELSPKMIERGYGKIVNISSIWSQVSKPGRAVYSSTKSAINGLTRSAAIELAAHNIQVNAVAPGFVDTDLTRRNNSPEQLEIIRSNIPTKRLAQTSEIAELVYFLVSEKNTYITGQTIFIDGGFSCQ
ncbi:MAG: SDR family oxidoreductase [Rickettsiales bacterium]|nr:SDR family oxidoreductase [Rickettsiales bacterium]